MPSKLDWNTPKHIHFVGIGGISMSALATILQQRGWRISGSDLKQSTLTDRLVQRGATIYLYHSADNVNGADVVVYTSAVKPDNPELVRARELGIPVYVRAELLGELMAESQFGIAVAGSHGKTTTTAMIGLMLDRAGKDPTVLVGGELDAIQGNVKVGNGQFLVAEACEYFDSFLSLKPLVGIILNIDVDHLDYFRNLEHIKETFRRFALLVPPNGYLIACGDDANVRDILHDLPCKVITYGMRDDVEWQAQDIDLSAGKGTFSVMHNGELLGRMSIQVPGRHNVSNALAAVALGSTLGLSFSTIAATLGQYEGTHRRFDYLGTYRGALVYDDYAHHPSEIRATLEAAKAYGAKRVICVFQPHTYTRTKALLNDFANAFAGANMVLLTDIYAAREKDTYGISTADLAAEMSKTHSNSKYVGSLQDAAKVLSGELGKGDLLITMGAGDVYQVAQLLLSNNRQIL